MSKRDLAYVLVKLSGFSWIVLAVFTSIARITNSIADAVEHRNSTSSGYAWILTTVVQIILAVIVIRAADKITDWLFGGDKT